MQHKDLLTYYMQYLALASSYMPSPKNRLRPKELKFLAYCCVFESEGNDPNVFPDLAQYLIDLKVCKDPKEVSTYKTKLSIKKWIKSSRYKFEIIDSIIDLSKPKIFKIEYVGNKKKMGT